MCDSRELYQFLDLGFTPPADQFRRLDQLREPDVYYPLQVCVCEGCGLVQLGYVVSPEVLYRNDYPYESSTTQTGHRHWKTFARAVVAGLDLKPDDLVVDIGSNVGVLLSAFADCGMRVLGVDPAANIVMLARERGVDTICDFFNEGVAEEVCASLGKAAIVTATNVFAHVDDLTSFMKNVQRVLAERGVFIFEAPYLGNLIRHNEYDTIYHEHLSYLSMQPLGPFFARFGMEVFDVQQVDIHGGSFRVFVGHQGQRPIAPDVGQMLREEAESHLSSRQVLGAFADRVAENKRELTWLLHSLKHEGKSIVAVSAPAKGMTLLNYCGIDGGLLDFVTEKSRLKIGRYTPGAHIPVVPDSKLLETQPDYALLLAWNFSEEIIQNLDAFRKAGGKFIIPIPRPTVV